jgi:hypothetical protein
MKGRPERSGRPLLCSTLRAETFVHDVVRFEGCSFARAHHPRVRVRPECSDRDGSGDHGASETVGSESASTSASATTEPEVTTDSGSASDTGAPVDPCLAADPMACPDECELGTAWQVIDDACATNSVSACVPGGSKPEVPPTTYWAIGPTGPLFLEYGGACSANAEPGSWRECNGAPDEPADCACFCQQGYCRGDDDRRALDQCDLPASCDPVWVDPQFGAANHDAEQCVLEALRDHVPGVYEVTISNGFSGDTTRYYVFADEVVRIELHFEDVIACPAVSLWGPASRCTLATSDYFAGCLELQVPGDDCVLHPGAWVEACEAATPSC